MTKKAVCVLRIDKNEYKPSINTPEYDTRKADGQEATTTELVEEMYQEWQI